MKCKQCNKEYEAKRSTSEYCSPKCKQEFYRNSTKPVTVTPVTLRDAKPVTVTSLEQCRYCGTVLPKLSRPRQCTGACYSCAVEHGKPSMKLSKDITCSSHLPLDIQRTINRLSKDDDQEHNRRTAIAIDYQHKQPDRYYSTGIGGAS